MGNFSKPCSISLINVLYRALKLTIHEKGIVGNFSKPSSISLIHVLYRALHQVGEKKGIMGNFSKPFSISLTANDNGSRVSNSNRLKN